MNWIYRVGNGYNGPRWTTAGGRWIIRRNRRGKFSVYNNIGVDRASQFLGDFDTVEQASAFATGVLRLREAVRSTEFAVEPALYPTSAPETTVDAAPVSEPAVSTAPEPAVADLGSDATDVASDVATNTAPVASDAAENTAPVASSDSESPTDPTSASAAVTAQETTPTA